MTGIMRNGHCPNLKVKHLCVYQLLPKLVNLTVPFLKFEQSEAFLMMLRRASKIKWGTGKAKAHKNQKHIMPYINLNKDFLKAGGLVLSDDIKALGNFESVLKTFQINYTHTTGSSEQYRREALKTIFLYLQQLNVQVVSKIQGATQLETDEERFRVLSTTKFLPAIMTGVLPVLRDFFDSVREEACIVTEYIVTHFLTHEP